MSSFIFSNTDQWCSCLGMYRLYYYCCWYDIVSRFLIVVWWAHWKCWLMFLDIAIELQHLRNSLPDQVVVQRIEERLSALGNCIACNDHVALTHTDLDRVLLCSLIVDFTLPSFICFVLEIDLQRHLYFPIKCSLFSFNSKNFLIDCDVFEDGCLNWSWQPAFIGCVSLDFIAQSY